MRSGGALSTLAVLPRHRGRPPNTVLRLLMREYARSARQGVEPLREGVRPDAGPTLPLIERHH